MSTTRPVVAGNWKMHLGPKEGGGVMADLAEAAATAAANGVEVLVFPPALTLGALGESGTVPPGIALGAQNVHWLDSGAFTGEVSIPMLGDVGANHVLVGHSERRHVFGETDEEVGLKVQAIRRHGLVPVICVGETLDERRGGDLEAVILRQLGAVTEALRESTPSPDFLIAYEPVWAIGTGETATPEDASAAHALIRAALSRELGVEGDGIRILYGGSVKPENASALMGETQIDGVLVGGASLDPVAFSKIIGSAGPRS